jgi:Mn2+/Fe2+ NRAMP family transporter
MTEPHQADAPGYEAKHPDPKIEADRQLLKQAHAEGTGSTLKAFVRLSGPGWLQSAITLGGGSLAGSLFLGVIAGYEMMWFQPLMMILGVIMLSGIAYVALSTGEKPFHAINKHINPVLGWGWLIAAAMANMVWAMPQFSLGTAALQQNLLPGLLGGEGGKYICIVALFVAATAVIWFYDSGGWGIKIFEWVIKAMVAVVVLSFFGVVIALSVTGGLPWGEVAAGFIPDFSLLFHPSTQLQAALDQTTNSEYWRDLIMTAQRDRMAAAAATAVGINMTFLLPYSMLRKGWDSNFRGLASFDLATGLFIPFLLATSCVVIASANQFHASYDKGLLGGEPTKLTQKLEPKYEGKLDGYLTAQADVMQSLGRTHDATLKKVAAAQKEAGKPALSSKLEAIKTQAGEDQAAYNKAIGNLAYGYTYKPADSDEQKQIVPASQKQQLRAEVPQGDKKMAAMLIGRDAFQFATSLQELLGKGIAQYIFGIGVVGMAISTIIILMLINGFCLTEAFALPLGGVAHRIGAIIPGITGAMGFIFLWGDDQARFLLAVPTSVFGMALLPIAYVTFIWMMNSKALLGEHRPQGGKRLAMNLAMLVALAAAGIGAGWAIWSKVHWYGVGAVIAFIALVLIVHFARAGNKQTA